MIVWQCCGVAQCSLEATDSVSKELTASIITLMLEAIRTSELSAVISTKGSRSYATEDSPFSFKLYYSFTVTGQVSDPHKTTDQLIGRVQPPGRELLPSQ
jgi:hypothetical protein